MGVGTQGSAQVRLTAYVLIPHAYCVLGQAVLGREGPEREKVWASQDCEALRASNPLRVRPLRSSPLRDSALLGFY